jgi:hypothetical protein
MPGPANSAACRPTNRAMPRDNADTARYRERRVKQPAPWRILRFVEERPRNLRAGTALVRVQAVQILARKPIALLLDPLGVGVVDAVQEVGNAGQCVLHGAYLEFWIALKYAAEDTAVRSRGSR